MKDAETSSMVPVVIASLRAPYIDATIVGTTASTAQVA